jgi:hypothetical protein
MNQTHNALTAALSAMRSVIDTGALKHPPTHLTQADVDNMRVELHTAIELAREVADLNAPAKDFEPRTLEGIADTVSQFRVGTLLCDVDTDGADVNAEQFFLLALTALEQAERYFKLASYAQARHNAETRMR